MTGLGLGLLLGSGLVLVWWSCWPSVPRRAPRRRRTAFADDLVQAGVAGVGPVPFAVACVVAAVTVGLVAMLLTRVPAIGGCLALAVGAGPVAWVRGRARRRRDAVRALWADAVDDLVSAARAGLSLPEALSQLSLRGPEQLRWAFVDFARDYRATGHFAEALDGLKQRLADPVADRIVESLRLAREVGGSDLGRLLRTLADFLREDVRLRSELEGRQGWTVNAARLAVAAPWIVLLLLSGRGETVQAYARPAGAVVLGVGALACVLAYRVMVRIARLPDEPRVLR